MKYRNLGRSGLRVSRICMGTMTYGMKDWGCDRDMSIAITNRFIEAGGNFFDTADMYSQGVSEQYLGHALKNHDRDDLVVATKCWFRMRPSANAMGLSRKHILESIDASLQRLGTDYIDLYQVHGPDPFTPMEETLGALNDLVRAGKVRYIGCSNYYAWQIVKSNAISDQLGLARLCSSQNLYNLIRRDIEREILPACQDQGMGLLCWSPLASGMLTGKYPRGKGPAEGTRIAHRAAIDMPRYWNESTFQIIDLLKQIANTHNLNPSQIALAWLLHDPRVTSVIIGARNIDQLSDNLVVGDWDLPPQDQRQLCDVIPFEHGYPREWIDMTFEKNFNQP